MIDPNFRDISCLEKPFEAIKRRTEKYAEHHAKKYTRWVLKNGWRKFGNGYTRFKNGTIEAISESELYRRFNP